MKRERQGVPGVCDRFPDIDQKLINWGGYVTHMLLSEGWNVRETGRDDTGFFQKSNTIYSNPVLEEVTRIKMDQTLNEVSDTHNIWRRLPLTWRKVLWAMYILHYESAEKLGEVAAVDRRHVQVLVGMIFDELDLHFRALRHMRHAA